ncbi:M23 family metallopeptidase [Nitrosococcus watsonii]|uniref:Peptidase M23 n=1 Tax=Nitrosococcus watsoni (strain C-113) TaxID=105559 RepID=D8KBP5_NITWC|nr:M23 family metallopeptidase [Nitrosococcus watsonii]ADJ27656.1 Peptidase M23 [Nitrosococcus watsonii C-113]
MIRGLMGWLGFGWLFLCPAWGAEPMLELNGVLQQGSLVIGRTEPGTQVFLDGRWVRVSKGGSFLIGFGRDAKPKSILKLVTSDGAYKTRELKIAQRQYQIQRIEGLPSRKVTPRTEDLARIRKEAALVRKAREMDDSRTDFLSGFIWPVHGAISGVYGSQRILNGQPRRPHYGIDIAAPTGTPVRAPADGLVTLVHPGMFFSGGTLILDHGHGLSSAFLHLHRILVKEGEQITQGEIIAEVGATGRVTGAHLDWRINLFQTRLDPQLLVAPMPAGGMQ